MLTIGKCFRSFKSMLIVKYILPFKYQPELLKRPPIKYTFIRDEEWTMFVKDRLSKNFKVKLQLFAYLLFTFINYTFLNLQDYREVKKEIRKKHIYNHHLSRKGYASLEEEMVASGLIETIDRSILWKKAREKRTAHLMKWPYQ